MSENQVPRLRPLRSGQTVKVLASDDFEPGYIGTITATSPEAFRVQFSHHYSWKPRELLRVVQRQDLAAEMKATAELAIPMSKYHHHIHGNVLWWKFPIEEPPYCGSPLDDDWPGHHTHFTTFVVPTTIAPERSTS